MKALAATFLLIFGLSARAEDGPKILLFVGDSHATGPFGDRLEKLLRDDGKFMVTREAIAGYSATNWLVKLPILHFTSSAASAVVIALGTYDASQTRCDSTDDIQKLVRELKTNSPACYFVGPPNFPIGPITDACPTSDYNAYVDQIGEIAKAEGCTFIDSRKIKVNEVTLRPDENDMMRFRLETADKWAREVARKIIPAPKQQQAR